jgi:hypothetical protein
MSTGAVRTIAASVGRRLRARRGRSGGPAVPRVRDRAEPPPSIPLPLAAVGPLGEPEEQGAPDAELDALRGALVRELDRLAAGDTCSASFRRAS